jgi:hypothetical protein
MEKRKHTIRFGILQLITVILFFSGGIYYALDHWPKNTKKNNSSSTSAATQTDPNAKFLVIPEWNIKIKLSKPIENAYYDTKTGSELDSRSLRSASLKDEPACAKDAQSIATVFKVKKDDVDEQLNRKYMDTQNGVVIGPNFYFIQTSQFSCTTKPEKAELLQSIRDAFADAARTIQSK